MGVVGVRVSGVAGAVPRVGVGAMVVSPSGAAGAGAGGSAVELGEAAGVEGTVNPGAGGGVGDLVGVGSGVGMWARHASSRRLLTICSASDRSDAGMVSTTRSRTNNGNAETGRPGATS